MLDPVHWDINMIIAMQCQPHPPLRALTTEVALQAITFISALVMWIDDTYESILEGGNIKEDV